MGPASDTMQRNGAIVELQPHTMFDMHECSFVRQHLQEAVVADQQRGAIDAQVQNAVVAGADDDACCRCDQLHPLAPLNAHLATKLEGHPHC
jgi:hypothetical protein